MCVLQLWQRTLEGTNTELGQQGATESSQKCNKQNRAAVHSGSWSLFTGCGMTSVCDGREFRGSKSNSSSRESRVFSKVSEEICERRYFQTWTGFSSVLEKL